MARRRVAFAMQHVGKTAAQWNEFLQAVGDIKEFTFYPRELRPKFKQLRSPWTYMRAEERFKPAFVRPKRWFKRSDYKKVLKQKVFGMTTSTGKCLAVLLPKPLTAAKWVTILKTRVHPFLQKQFPGKRHYRVLLDGEPVLRAEVVEAAMADKQIKLLDGWPKYSPDLNPQENVWPAAEEAIRAAEKNSDTFADFQKRCVKATRYIRNLSLMFSRRQHVIWIHSVILRTQAVAEYVGAEKLVGSMAKRLRKVVHEKGAMLDQ